MCVSPVLPFRKLWANLCSNHPKNTVVLSLPVTWNQDMGQKRIILPKPKSFILDRFPDAWTWSWQRISLKCFFFNDVIYRLGLQIIGSNWLDCSARILSTPTTLQKRNHFDWTKTDSFALYFRNPIKNSQGTPTKTRFTGEIASEILWYKWYSHLYPAKSNHHSCHIIIWGHVCSNFECFFHV